MTSRQPQHPQGGTEHTPARQPAEDGGQANVVETLERPGQNLLQSQHRHPPRNQPGGRDKGRCVEQGTPTIWPETEYAIPTPKAPSTPRTAIQARARRALLNCSSPTLSATKRTTACSRPNEPISEPNLATLKARKYKPTSCGESSRARRAL